MTDDQVIRREYMVIVTMSPTRRTYLGQLPGVHGFGDFEAMARDQNDLGKLLANDLGTQFFEQMEKLGDNRTQLPRQTYAAPVGSWMHSLHVAYDPQTTHLKVERFCQA